MKNKANKNVYNEQSEPLRKLQKIVADTMKQEKLIVENLLHPPKEVITVGQKLSDKVARFAGSWGFISSFLILLILWIIYNTNVEKGLNFDPYPFILMNLILSCIAALQAPVIIMSQNRQEEKDRMRAENDYLVNLKAELEIRSLHQKIDLLLQEELKTLYKIQEKQLQLLNELKVKFDNHTKT